MAAKNSIKKMFKKLLVRVFLGGQKIVITSNGRSGSTMLFDAIADSMVKHKFHLKPNTIIAKKIKRLCTGYVDRINKLPNEVCHVCKTHDIYEYLPKSNYKFIFIYGDPLDAAMSVAQEFEKKGQEWFTIYQYHLKANGKYSDLYEKDVLNYQEQLKSWLTQRNNNIMCIDYNDLWDEKESLSKFIGFNVDLPARRPRMDKPANNNINKEFFTKLRELKDSLKNDYRSAITDRLHN